MFDKGFQNKEDMNHNAVCDCDICLSDSVTSCTISIMMIHYHPMAVRVILCYFYDRLICLFLQHVSSQRLFYGSLNHSLCLYVAYAKKIIYILQLDL